MLLSRLLAGFTRGQSDALRKAMGKKIIAILNELKGKFIEGGVKNGHDKDILEKIWADWEKFASYAFNKSHATCYSWVAYQTAYLKAHYPAEFMAANLTRNKDDIKEVTKFMQECKSMGISVLGPSINASFLHFTSDKDDNIRFGLGGVKGVGEGAVEAIIKERKENGPFKDTFDFFERINLSACNRKAIESLVLAGAFDELGDITREQFFVQASNGETFLDQLMRYANKYQNDNCMQGTLFDDIEEIEIQRPSAPVAPETSSFERLNKEKELVGIYLSAHPLDDYKTEITIACNADIGQLNDSAALDKKYGAGQIVVAGVVRSVEEILTKRNTSLTKFTIEGYSGEVTLTALTKKIQDFRHLLFVNSFVVLTGKMEYTWRAINAQRSQRDGKPTSDNPEEKEFSVSRIEELSSLRGKVGKKITLRFPLDGINSEVINAVQPYINAQPKEGQVAVELAVDVYDPVSNLSIQSKGQYPIVLTEELLSMLKLWSEEDDSRFVYFVEK